MDSLAPFVVKTKHKNYPKTNPNYIYEKAEKKILMYTHPLTYMQHVSRCLFATLHPSSTNLYLEMFWFSLNKKLEFSVFSPNFYSLLAPYSLSKANLAFHWKGKVEGYTLNFLAPLLLYCPSFGPKRGDCFWAN